MIKILQDLYNCNENSPYFDNATTTTTTTIQILDKHINYILIHNISSFFYDLQIVDQYNYQSLGFEQFNQPDKSPPQIKVITNHMARLAKIPRLISSLTMMIMMMILLKPTAIIIYY